jgi:transposase
LEFQIFPGTPGANVQKNHPARVLAQTLEKMDLGFVRQIYARRGGYPYEPVHLLGPILYGMSQGVRTGRELEEACRYDDRYKLLAGGHTPDDRTFERFIVKISPFLDELLSQVLVLARSKGKARGNEVALDGCKMPGSSSWWKSKEDSTEKPSDPDARLMNSHGRRMVGYNALIAVDTADGLIVGAQVSNEQNDFHVVPDIIEATLCQLGEYPAAALADAGFDVPESILYLEEAGIDSVVAPKTPVSDALYEDEDGRLMCPAGKSLVLVGTMAKDKEGLRRYDSYRPQGGCRGCPLKANCSFFRKTLDVPEGADPGAKIRNRVRFQSATYHRAMVRRRSVETPFAFLRRHDGFERFRGRSLDKAKAEFRLWVASYNLRKILRTFKSLVKLEKLLFELLKRFQKAGNLGEIRILLFPGQYHRQFNSKGLSAFLNVTQ